MIGQDEQSRGSRRRVWHINEDWVLKLDPSRGSNLSEALVWFFAQDTEYGELFAEIKAYASDGSWLIMRRCVPLPHRNFMNLEVFELQTKLRAIGIREPVGANLGWHPDGRLVCIDYDLNANNDSIFSDREPSNMEPL